MVGKYVSATLIPFSAEAPPLYLLVFRPTADVIVLTSTMHTFQSVVAIACLSRSATSVLIFELGPASRQLIVTRFARIAHWLDYLNPGTLKILTSLYPAAPIVLAYSIAAPRRRSAYAPIVLGHALWASAYYLIGIANRAHVSELSSTVARNSEWVAAALAFIAIPTIITIVGRGRRAIASHVRPPDREGQP